MIRLDRIDKRFIRDLSEINSSNHREVYSLDLIESTTVIGEQYHMILIRELLSTRVMTM